MATYKHLRSSTANKRPTTSIADGQIAINTNTTSPGLFFKDSAGTGIVKVGPVHVGTTAPNVSPAAGGSSGNYTGEQWLDTSVSPNQMKVWNGSAWVGIVADELPVSKLQDGAARQLIQTDAAGTGVEWTSSIDLPGTLDVTGAATLDSTLSVAGNVSLGAAATLTFEGATDDAFETTLSVADPTADRSIVLPNVSGTVVTTGDSGSVTSAMIADGTIVNGDVNASAAIAGTKISPDFGSQTVTTTGVVSIAAGTAGAPSLAVTGDTNTGIYSPGADQLAISTGGTGRVFVDSSGKVGVGTASPSTALDVSGAISLGAVAIPSAGTARIFSRNTDNNLYIQTGSGNAINLLDASQNTMAVFEPTSVRFQISNSEKARLDSSGRLLVGTSTSVASDGKLQVKDGGIVIYHASSANGAGYDLRFATDGGATARVHGQIQLEQTAGNGGTLKFSTTADGASSPTERMRIKNNGTINFSNVAVYADNAAATTGGLAVGDVYRTSTGQLMIRY